MNAPKLTIIGDTINNAFARARKAFLARSLPDYQKLAQTQVQCGAHILDVNLDGTQQMQVKQTEMLALLPELVPALQEAVSVPLCFDNPSVDYHRIALQHYDRKKSGQPVINSIAASRERLDEMLELVAAYDTAVIVMASEQFVSGGTAQCLTAPEAYRVAKQFVEMLVTKAKRRLDQIIIDPGLAPVGADTYGLVNVGLDAMTLIRRDPDLQGVHLTIGLSNFAWGMPKGVREQLEKAFLTLSVDRGLDYAIASAEKSPAPLPADHPMVAKLRNALDVGRPQAGETAETSGYRQAEAIMEICSEAKADS